jgi:hypothetical protein
MTTAQRAACHIRRVAARARATDPRTMRPALLARPATPTACQTSRGQTRGRPTVLDPPRHRPATGSGAKLQRHLREFWRRSAHRRQFCELASSRRELSQICRLGTLTLFAPDDVDHRPMGEMRGIEAFEEVVRMCRTAVPDVHCAIES